MNQSISNGNSGSRARWENNPAQRLRSLMSDLSGLHGEREVLSEVRDSLMVAFEFARRVEVYLLDSTRGELIPTFQPGEGKKLLVSMCAGLSAIPAARRAAPVVPDLIPYLVVPSLADAREACGAMMSAPLLSGNTLLGLVVLEATLGAPDFTVADLDALVTIVDQAAVAFESVRTRPRRGQEKRPLLQHDLELARRIQRSFLPALASKLSGFRIAAEYRPAFDVGGDFYDVVSCGPGRVTAVVGDVAGKGVAAALVMSRVSSEFRRLATVGLRPEEILTQLNQSFGALCLDDSFATAVCVSVDASAGLLTVANAGHVPPLIRTVSGTVRPLGCLSSLPLGMLSSEVYLDEQFRISQGDIVLMMTDGVIEPLTRDEDPIGMRTLLRVIAEAPADVVEINRRILSELDQVAMASRYDDVALLGLEVSEGVRMLAA